jgi:hypothetical protein
MKWDRESLLIVKAIVLCGGTSADAAKHLQTTKREAAKAARSIGMSFGRGNAYPIGEVKVIPREAFICGPDLPSQSTP